jgi:thiamine biosynthesis protein ThiS
MRFVINGKEGVFDEGITVKGLLDILNIKPQGIALELNLEIVPKSRYDETVLKDGDKIEIVQMVGGG